MNVAEASPRLLPLPKEVSADLDVIYLPNQIPFVMALSYAFTASEWGRDALGAIRCYRAPLALLISIGQRLVDSKTDV